MVLPDVKHLLGVVAAGHVQFLQFVGAVVVQYQEFVSGIETAQ